MKSSLTLLRPLLCLQQKQTSRVGRRQIFTIIDQATCAYREFLGGNRVKLEPGVRLNLPFFHTIEKVNLRESFIAVESLAGYTKDNVPVWISGSLFYVIDDPELACYKIQNYSGSVEAIGRSAMRAVIGQFEFDSIIRERSAINTALSQTIGNTLKDWGSTCTRFEIGMFQPQNQAVAEQLQLQLEAERKRRENELNTLARIKTAEGDKETAILKSEGELVSRTNQSEGDLILSQRQSDAEKYSIDVTTAALVKQLEAVAQLFDGNKDKAANYLLEKQRLEHLSVLAKSPNKVYFADPDSMLPKARALTDMLT